MIEFYSRHNKVMDMPKIKDF